MAQPVDTLIFAKWILTAEGTDLLEQHALAVQQGKILAIVPAAQARIDYQAQHVYELDEHLLLPGFVNAHGHAAMSLFRGMADDLPLMTWLQEHIWPAEGQHVSREFVYQGTKLAIAEMLLSGTTCFSDMYFYPEAAAEAASEYHMRACLFTPVLDFPTPYASNADEYIEKAVQARDKYKHNPLITLGFGPHAPYTVSDAPLQKIRMLADQLGAPIQIHLHETAFEVEDAVAKTGQRPSQRLAELGLFGLDVSAVHVTQVDETDLEIFSRFNVQIVHCPESNLKLASGFCPVNTLQKAGINVALGTDGAASNNDLNMLSEMHTAALLAKAVAQDATALPALEAIRMATLNGAKALGLDEQTGSLVPGKYADMQAISFAGIQSAPMYNPLSQLVYSSSREQIEYVWVAGRLQVNKGELTHINRHELIEMAQSYAAKIQQKSPA